MIFSLDAARNVMISLRIMEGTTNMECNMSRKLLVIALAIGSQACYASDGAAAPVPRHRAALPPSSGEEVANAAAEFNALIVKSGLRTHLESFPDWRSLYVREWNSNIRSHAVEIYRLEPQLPITVSRLTSVGPDGHVLDTVQLRKANDLPGGLSDTYILADTAVGVFTRGSYEWGPMVIGACENVRQIAKCLGPIAGGVGVRAKELGDAVNRTQVAMRLLVNDQRLTAGQVTEILRDWLRQADAVSEQIVYLAGQLFMIYRDYSTYHRD
jgi:hypothetical protein